ncbi:hypothetical protein BKA83DRAFT_4230148 [Pisolithus microcarpus]|nr:hypothetical protein BKA83DRAFT_4230148 [Pisolithus microcarpus]
MAIGGTRQCAHFPFQCHPHGTPDSSRVSTHTRFQALVLWILAEGFRAIVPGAQSCRWQFVATELCEAGSFRAVTTEEQALDDFASLPETANRGDTPDLQTRSTANSWSLGGRSDRVICAFRTLVDSRTSFWHAAVIQFSGLFILRIDHVHASPWSLLSTLALCNSAFFSLIDMVRDFTESRTIHLINSSIFAFSCIILLVLSIFQTFPTHESIYIVHLIQGISTSLASTILITCIALRFYQASSAFLGCFIMAIACIIYLHNFWKASEAWREASTGRSRIVIPALAFMLFLASGYTLAGHWITGFSPISESTRQCIPKQSPSHLFSQLQGNYSHFDNILLIILYIGPATREDAGFTHSYDVYVDSYQSDEDISDPWNYKMAGRMAHHMLYTALQDNECFEGYLWAPFDTLLNVPRLQQFNQSLFWYHSPWGQPVPNPAFGDMYHEATLDRSRHAPVANISPDPSLNPHGDDPHVGVSECMGAFRKVPSYLRENLAALTDGETRLYRRISRYHDSSFETNCFLEIATPTTLHLVVPPGEPIQFWWIYQPPFNASFVRQKWVEGFEVDTFHTFHWGERGSDGVWKGNYHHYITFPVLTEPPS